VPPSGSDFRTDEAILPPEVKQAYLAEAQARGVPRAFTLGRFADFRLDVVSKIANRRVYGEQDQEGEFEALGVAIQH
jgi:hypothetical protein